MAVVIKHFYGNGGIFAKAQRYLLDASVVDGQFVIRSTSTSSAGEIVSATTTGMTDAIGVVVGAVTYSAAQATATPREAEQTALVECDPFSVIEMFVSGGATAGTAINTTSPATIITNTSADTAGITVTAAEVGTVSMAGGLLFGRTGNNAGHFRRSDAHTNSTSMTVEVAFPRTIAAGDTFYRFPWSKASVTVQLTSDLTQANSIIAVGTGAPLLLVDYPKIDYVNDVVTIHVKMVDSFYATIA